MTWLFAFVIVAVLGAVAVVASGRGGLRRTYDDRPDVRVPDGRPLTADDLARVRFTTAFRGYRMAEVDALVERLTRQLREEASGPESGHEPGQGPERVGP